MENSEQPIGLIKDRSKQPAFPVSFAFDSNEGITKVTHFGLTKREKFAESAMIGILSNHRMIDTTNYEWVAEKALGYADELLKQLEDGK